MKLCFRGWKIEGFRSLLSAHRCPLCDYEVVYACTQWFEFRATYTVQQSGLQKIAFDMAGRVTFRVNGETVLGGEVQPGDEESIRVFLTPRLRGVDLDLAVGQQVQIEVDFESVLPGGVPLVMTLFGVDAAEIARRCDEVSAVLVTWFPDQEFGNAAALGAGVGSSLCTLCGSVMLSVLICGLIKPVTQKQQKPQWETASRQVISSG